MCDLPARGPPDGGQDPSGTPAAGRGPTRRGLLRSAGAAADVTPAAPWVTTAEAQTGNQGLLARLWMDELPPLFETGARINTQQSVCLFLGRWAPVPRDRGHGFHGIVGSHSTPRAVWPTSSWGQS